MVKKRVMREEIEGREHMAGVPGQRFANKDVWCAGWDDRIDRDACMVRGFRQPQKCAAAKCP